MDREGRDEQVSWCRGEGRASESERLHMRQLRTAQQGQAREERRLQSYCLSMAGEQTAYHKNCGQAEMQMYIMNHDLSVVRHGYFCEPPNCKNNN